MNRGKKAIYNSAASLLAEGIAIVCGFILPRLILSSFGSNYNGLTQSVTQFLSVVALLRAGVGGATRASLYKTLANKDEKQLSATIRATELFMRKVALIFAAFVIVFSCIYPLVVSNDFGWLFSATLVLIIAVSTFVEYYFGITYHILLQADQKQYISSLLGSGTTILNTLLSVILIKLGCGIHIVKLGSAAAFCVTPIVLNRYAKAHYHIDKSIEPDFSSINQRWNAMLHQVAGFIYSNTDIMVITIFLNLKEVSVYSVYCLVSNGLKRLMTTVTTGVEAAFGDMIARGNDEVLTENVKVYETLLHSIVCILFGTALILISPFVGVYTRGIHDVNYLRPAFGYLLLITEVVHILRQPYHSIVEASGHYKQTKHIAFTQAILNLGISIILINILGLNGVIIGTLISDIYRGIAYRIYVKKNILHSLTITDIIKRITVSAVTILLIVLISNYLPHRAIDDYWAWVIYAIPVTILSITITLILNYVFYKNDVEKLIKKLKNSLNAIIHKNREK